MKVIYDGQTLIENTSYTLTYADNKNAGTASVTIKGKNSLHGQIVEYFTIQKADQNAPTGLTPTAETMMEKMMVRLPIWQRRWNIVLIRQAGPPAQARR